MFCSAHQYDYGSPSHLIKRLAGSGNCASILLTVSGTATLKWLDLSGSSSVKHGSFARRTRRVIYATSLSTLLGRIKQTVEVQVNVEDSCRGTGMTVEVRLCSRGADQFVLLASVVSNIQ